MTDLQFPRHVRFSPESDRRGPERGDLIDQGLGIERDPERARWRGNSGTLAMLAAFDAR
jgi:hypothetical protein